MIKLRLAIGLLLLAWHAQCQTYADWWYFGDSAGIHFASGGPVAVTDGAMDVYQGNATISDAFGNLLFYTNGETVWDASHSIMQNGTGLQGGNNAQGGASQSAFIVPRPNHPDEYYLFTIKKAGGMYYSKIDMDLNGGLGAVLASEKNVPLIPFVTEKIACLRKPNNLDFWVVTMRLPGDTAYAYEVTSAGLNLVPVKSNTGLNLVFSDRIGYLKASQQNDRLAMTVWYLDTAQTNAHNVHMYSFDNVTGEVAYDFAIDPLVADTLNYGVEFSPDGTRLYVQSYHVPDLRQYDLTAGGAAAISASEVLVGLGYSGSAGGALQLGPDGKIYVARNSNNRLAAVHFPNSLGNLCGYDHDAVYLGGRLDKLGLPQFIPFILDGSVVLNDVCFNDTSWFFSSYLNADSVRWDFGDTASGVLNTSTLANPAHLFTDTGTFKITVIAYEAFLTDTSEYFIHIRPRQSLDLGADTMLCTASQVTYNISQPYSTYLWGGGSTDSAVTVFSDTVLTVQLFGVCDTLSDTLRVRFWPETYPTLGNDTVICNNDSFTISLSDPVFTYLWSNGSTGPDITITADEVLSVQMLGVCDTLYDTISVAFGETFTLDLGPDTLVCGSDSLVIGNAITAGHTILWNTGDTTDEITVTEDGQYSVLATNVCTAVIDSIEVRLRPLPLAILPSDTLSCFDAPIILTRPQSPKVTYVWSDSSSAKNYPVDTTETVWLAAFNECGFSVDTVHVVFNGEIKSELGEDTMICDRDSIVLRATWPGAAYQWNTGDTSDTIWTVREDFTYGVTVTKGACEKRTSIHVDLNKLACPNIDCGLQHGNVFTPNGDGLNDLFRAWSDCDINSFDLSIYNRWGQLVHYSRNAAFGWDGYINGEAAPEGTYFFRIQFRDQVVVDVDRNIYQGSIMLMR